MSGRTQPVVDEVSEVFWDATREGKLLLQRNPRTGRIQFYPRGHCVDDGQGEPEWIESAGRGTVYSYSVIHRSPFEGIETPYVYALIELEEGVLMSGNVVNTDPTTVRIGSSVQLTFEKFGEYQLPVFEPTEAA